MKRTFALSFVAAATAFQWGPARAINKHISMSAAMSQDELKKLVGYKAVDDYVKSGMVVGLGTGSTAYFAVERVGQKIKSGWSLHRLLTLVIYHQLTEHHISSGELNDIVCIPTSERTKEQALSLGIPLCTLNEKSRLDVSFNHKRTQDTRDIILTVYPCEGGYRWCG